MCSLNDHDVMYNGRLDIIMWVSFNISLFGNLHSMGKIKFCSTYTFYNFR